MKRIILSLTLLASLAANLSAMQTDEEKLKACTESHFKRLLSALKECEQVSKNADPSSTQEFLEDQKAACYAFMCAESNKAWHYTGCGEVKKRIQQKKSKALEDAHKKQ